jgi:hypothetical protein
MTVGSAVAFFHPTIDGARQSLPYIQADVPYMLGISVPPSRAGEPTAYADIDITQGVELIYSGLATGTFDIMQITSPTPVLFYENDVYVGQIIPEPATIFLLSSVILFRKRGLNRK